VDPTYEIAFDAHAKIFDVKSARQLGNALAPYDPLFFEEPLRPENIELYGDLNQGLNCTLATGESLYSRNEFLRLLQVKGADLIQPDICVVGGISEMRRIATLAEAHFVGVAPHNPMGPLATAVNVHFAAAQQNFRILEYRLPVGQCYIYGGTEIETREDATRYVLDPYLPKDGFLELRPDRPGWGVEMDEKAMEEDGYVHWQRRVPKRPDGSYAFA
jgi:galactonate dehydratase